MLLNKLTHTANFMDMLLFIRYLNYLKAREMPLVVSSSNRKVSLGQIVNTSILQFEHKGHRFSMLSSISFIDTNDETIVAHQWQSWHIWNNAACFVWSKQRFASSFFSILSYSSLGWLLLLSLLAAVGETLFKSVFASLSKCEENAIVEALIVHVWHLYRIYGLAKRMRIFGFLLIF